MAENAIITHIIVAMRVQEIWTLKRTYRGTRYFSDALEYIICVRTVVIERMQFF